MNLGIGVSPSFSGIGMSIDFKFGNDAFTFSAGINYTFRKHKSFGIKLGTRGIYLYTKGLKPESLVSDDIGAFYKLQIGYQFRSL